MRTLLLAVALAAGAAAPAAAFTGFRSPSANIGCYIDAAAGVRCDIARRDWRVPPRPASCDVDYGQGISLGRTGRARFVCAGDTALGPARVLGYDRRIRRGAYTCTSTPRGITCINRRTRHGFFLSRQRYRLF